jgi:hypothetical protein
MKKVTGFLEFRGISRNYTTRNSAEFRRNFSQFRTEYGIDGSKKKQTEFRVDGIPWTPYLSPTNSTVKIQNSVNSLSVFEQIHNAINANIQREREGKLV